MNHADAANELMSSIWSQVAQFTHAKEIIKNWDLKCNDAEELITVSYAVSELDKEDLNALSELVERIEAKKKIRERLHLHA